MRYQANPVEVDALVIKQVQPRQDTGHRIVTFEDGSSRIATPAMLARLTPSPGDYWVTQDDGYEYLNPKHVFERKYSPLAPEEA